MTRSDLTAADPQAAAHAAMAADPDWRVAAGRALSTFAGRRLDVALVFASSLYRGEHAAIVDHVWRALGAPLTVGATGIGVVSMDTEAERTPAVAVLGLTLPGATLSAVRVTSGMVDAGGDAEAWRLRLGVLGDEVRGWLTFANPFRFDTTGLIDGLAEAYPAVPVVGGIASPDPAGRESAVFLNGEAFPDGAVALAVGGPYDLVPMVSQGCDPIGEAWTITGIQENWIETISNRPAVSVLTETLAGVPEELRIRVQRNLAVGLAADEYRHEFHRGDFVIRGLVGIDQASGAIAIGAMPRVGQTIQFQVRDAAAADVDLDSMLGHVATRLDGRTPLAGILCTCNGRGADLFGTPSHDARAIQRKLGQARELPMSGLFCAGEIGPIGGRPLLHGFTASLGLIVPRDA